MAQGLDALGNVLGDDFSITHNHFVIDNVDDRVPSNPSADSLGKRNCHAVALVHNRLGAGPKGPAVVHGDHNVLCNVGQLPGEVTSVSGFKRRISQSLTSTVSRGEVLQDAQAFTEVCLDGRFNNLAGGLGHQTTHTSELTNLVHGTTRAGIHHAVDRVHVAGFFVEVRGQHGHQVEPNDFTRTGPKVDDLEVAFALGDHTSVVRLLNLIDLGLGLLQHLGLGVRNTDVAAGEGHARAGRSLETKVLQIVQQLKCGLAAEQVVTVRDQTLDRTLAELVVIERHPRGQNVVEQDAANGGFDVHLGAIFRRHFASAVHVDGHILAAVLDLGIGRQLDANRVEGAHGSVTQGHENFGPGGESPRVVPAGEGVLGEVIDTEHHVLGGRNDRAAVGGRENVVARKHQGRCLDLRLEGEGQVHRHLVTIEVCVETTTNQGVQTDRVTIDQHRLKCLNAHTVKGRRTVEHHRVVTGDLFQDVPDLALATLQHALGGLDRVGQAQILEASNDEGLEKLQGDLLGHSALGQR